MHYDDRFKPVHNEIQALSGAVCSYPSTRGSVGNRAMPVASVPSIKLKSYIHRVNIGHVVGAFLGDDGFS